MSERQSGGPAGGPRVVVTHGDPTPEELVAVVAALEAATAAERLAGRRGGGQAVPPWRRAALLEGAGGHRIASPADLPRW